MLPSDTSYTEVPCKNQERGGETLPKPFGEVLLKIPSGAFQMFPIYENDEGRSREGSSLKWGVGARLVFSLKLSLYGSVKTTLNCRCSFTVVPPVICFVLFGYFWIFG